jgi:Bifunctional DNA primase/polymerase, N-terminal/AAA domain
MMRTDNDGEGRTGTPPVLPSALEDAARGRKVIPVDPASKEPAKFNGTQFGIYSASDDPVRITQWFTDMPDAGVGIVAYASGLAVIDIDERHGGAIEALQLAGDMPATWTVRTPNGWHLYFQHPGVDLRGELDKHRFPGHDIKDVGYVLAPPTVRADGGTYTVVDDTDPAPMPDWLVDECEKRYTAPPETKGVDVGALGVPSIPALLEAAGWALQSSNGNGGVTYWTRPGKGDGTSAVHNHLGTDTLKVFSTAPECSGMTTEGTHNRLSVYTHLCHGGDFGAALKELTFKKLATKAGTIDVPEPGDGVFLVRADAVTVEDVEWFDDKLIPLRVVTLVVGIDGVGKSTVLYTKAAKATLGELPGVFYGTPCDVVVASSEDHAGTVIVPRLLAADADLEHVHIVKCRRYGAEGEIALPDDLPAVADVIEEVGARFLIVDPLVAHMPMNVDTHKAQHVRQVLAPLARIAEWQRLAVAAVVHFNGSPSTDVRSRISGSKALRDAARSVLVCGADPSDESRFVVVQDKNSFGPKAKTGTAYRIVTRYVERDGKVHETSGIEWLGDVPMDARQLLAGPDDPEARTEQDEAADFLRSYLAHGAQPSDDVKKAAAREGIAERTLQRARRTIGVEVERAGFQGGSTWALPFVPPPSGTDRGGTNGEGGTTVETQGDSATESASAVHSCQSQESGTNGETPSSEPDESDTPPATPEARVVTESGPLTCSKCGRKVASAGVWRCPYVSCRAWFRTAKEDRRD